jgi:GMP synthase (glutamine-hydrolysing)
MSHGDSVSAAPEGMRVTATTSGAPVAAFEDDERHLYGVQWHPEVLHSTFGQQVLENFLLRGAGLAGDWTAANVVEDLVSQVRSRSVRRGSSVACPVASTPRSRQPSCSVPSATS